MAIDWNTVLLAGAGLYLMRAGFVMGGIDVAAMIFDKPFTGRAERLAFALVCLAWPIIHFAMWRDRQRKAKAAKAVHAPADSTTEAQDHGA